MELLDICTVYFSVICQMPPYVRGSHSCTTANVWFVTCLMPLRCSLIQRLSDVLHPCSCGRKEDSAMKKMHKVNEGDSNAVCLVGLHACGDLSAVATEMFLQSPQLQLMVLVPCCYHRSATVEGNAEKEQEVVCRSFASFPLSGTLTNVLKEQFKGYEEYLGRPFLRLASQENCSRWDHWTEEQHEQHAENLMARAVLDLAALRQGVTLRKKRRRCVCKLKRSTFEAFLEDAMQWYDFILPNGDIVTLEKREQIRQETRLLWLQNNEFCSLAEALTGLQSAMQTLVECLILVDRVTYVNEQQHHLSVDIIKVMDEVLSPRCRALIVRKLS